MKFVIKFLRGVEVVTTVEAIRQVTLSEVTVGDMEDAVMAEKVLEKLLGLRVHIEQVE